MPSNRKTLTGILSFFLIALAVARGVEIFDVPTAFAATDPFDELNKMQVAWSTFIELGVTVSFILYPIITALLDPKVFLDISGGGQADLLLIWQVSRDIMNTIFAFMLVAGAMMTVVSAKQDYLKRFALKFVLGVILVNFSWFFPRVILDVSHVLAANIYQLPSLVGSTCSFRDGSGTLQPCTYPTDFKFFREDIVQASTSPGNPYKCVSNIVCYKPQPLDPNANVAEGIMAGLMMNHARLPELNLVLASTPVANASLLDKTLIATSHLIRVGLQLLLAVYITLILAGMAVALLVRIPILWFTMAFMPLMFLGFVLGEILPQQMNTMQIFKKFVNAAFLPAALAIPLSVGFILINALAFGPPPSSAGMLGQAIGPIMPGVNSLWELLWLLITIVIIWKGFKMALSIDQIFESATSSLTGFGDNLGILARNAPLNIPIPMGRDASTGQLKMGTLGQASSGVSAAASLSSRGALTPSKLRSALGGGSGSGGSGGGTNVNVVIDTASTGAIGTAVTNAATNSGNLVQRDIDEIVNKIIAANAGVTDHEKLGDKVAEEMRNNHGFHITAGDLSTIKSKIDGIVTP